MQVDEAYAAAVEDSSEKNAALAQPARGPSPSSGASPSPLFPDPPGVVGGAAASAIARSLDEQVSASRAPTCSCCSSAASLVS